ncbi:MAG TPA: ABC transporter substrate-binding protein [Bacillota bacterium]|nr:ABC transporter substrate-binding protein [Bacillota bacterium]
MKKLRVSFLFFSLIGLIVSGLVWGEEKELKTFTFYYGDSNARTVDLSETSIGKKITAITGVKVKTEYIVGSDERTKSGLMIAAGDYPDLILPHNETHKFVEAGALVPLDDFVAKSELVKKAYKGDLKKLAWKDGHIYFLSPIRPEPDRLYPSGGFYLPVDLLREAGWPVVTNIDQYFNLIRSYVKKHPTFNGKPTIGFTCEADDWRIYILKQSGTHLMGYANTGETIIDTKANTAHTYALASYTKAYIKKLNQLYLEGLFDKEAFSQNYDQYKAKIASGRVIGFFDERWQFLDATKSLEEQKLFDRVHVAMPVLAKGVKRDAYMFPLVFSNTSGIGISKNCKDKVAAWKFLERFLMDDIQKLNYWGIEGVDYSVVNGRMVKSPKQIQQLDDPDYCDKQGLTRFSWCFPRYAWGESYKYADGNYVSPKDTPEYFAYQYKPYEKEILKQYNKKTFADFMAPPAKPPYGYVWDTPVEDGSPERIALQKCEDVSKKYLPKLVTAKKGEFEKIWKQYGAEYRKIDTKRVEKHYTAEVQRRIKAWRE